MAVELEPTECEILQLLLDVKTRRTLAEIQAELPAYTELEIEAGLATLLTRNLVITHAKGSDTTWIISLDGYRALEGC